MPKAKTDAISLLKEDHKKVKEAFEQFEKMDHEDTATMQEIAAVVCSELKVHTTIEEQVFYPAVRELLDDDDLMNEAVVEHNSAKDLIAQLENMKPDDPMYAATFTVLGEYVQHHVEEEETEMFPKVRKLKLDLEALGEQMLALKEELTASA
jgi:hemerythrin-like domain-containing protein